MTDPFRYRLPQYISTPRFTMRRLDEPDAKDLFAAAQESHAGLYKWYGGALTKRDLTLEKVRAYIRNGEEDFENRRFIQYGAFDNAKGRLIGLGSLHHIDWEIPKGRIGYWVRKSEEKKGYATDIAHVIARIAFEKLHFERLEIRTATGNPASSAVPKKLGYKFLTVFEKNKKGNDGELWDLEIHVRFDTNGLPPMKIAYDDVLE